MVRKLKYFYGNHLDRWNSKGEKRFGQKREDSERTSTWANVETVLTMKKADF